MSTQTLTTAAQFEAIARQAGPCELVRGEVITLSPGGLEHNQIVANLHGLLWTWTRRTGLGRTMPGETGIVTGERPDTVRGADVVYFSYERLPRDVTPAGFTRVAPNLVAEIVGHRQGWREAVEKAGEYLRMGVELVWLVDAKSRRLHVYRPDCEPVVLNPEDTLQDDAVLPGFTCRVEELFAS